MVYFSQISEKGKARLSRNVAIVAAVFTALVSLLMLLNYLQIRSSEPLENKALTSLVERMSSEPGNQELIDDIRQLDLLARKAYFTSLWQIRAGAYLILFGAIMLVAALRIYFNLRFAIDKPSHESLKEKQKRRKTQYWVMAAGVVVLLLAITSTLFTIDHLDQFNPAVLHDGAATTGIEQVDLVPRQASQAASGLAATQQDQVDSSDTGHGDEPEALPVEAVTELSAVANTLTTEAVRLNHNAFRGAWGQGRSSRRNIPVSWDGASGNNILWKTEITTHGYNSPVLWQDHLFLSGANQSRRVVYCIDRNTGRMRWERDVSGIPGSPATPPRTTDDTGLAAPSLTTDGQKVFAIFGTGDIVAFDFSGNQRWGRNLGVPQNHYGHSSSLLTWDGKVFVQYDTQSGSKVMALDVSTGETIWETARSSGVSWASPILIQVNGQYQLVLSSLPDVAAYDIESGRQLWSVNCMSGEVGPSPAYGGGLVYAANEYARLAAINPANGQLVWSDNYYLPEVASPLYHDGLLYIATSYAVFACFDATNGEFLWEYDADDGFYSSPVYADGKIYIFDMGGKAYIFNPGKELQLIASPSLGERVYATPVFGDGKLFIRGNRHLYCIGQ